MGATPDARRVVLCALLSFSVVCLVFFFGFDFFRLIAVFLFHSLQCLVFWALFLTFPAFIFSLSFRFSFTCFLLSLPASFVSCLVCWRIIMCNDNKTVIATVSGV